MPVFIDFQQYFKIQMIKELLKVIKEYQKPIRGNASLLSEKINQEFHKP
jgi:hypothetical protein